MEHTSLSNIQKRNREEEIQESNKKFKLNNKEIIILEIVNQNISPSSKHEMDFFGKQNPFLQTTHFLQIVNNNNNQWTKHQINLKKISDPLFQKKPVYKQKLIILLLNYQDFEPRYMIELFISIMNPFGENSDENLIIISEIKQTLLNLVIKINQKILIGIFEYNQKIEEEEIEIIKNLVCSIIKLENIFNNFQSELNDFKKDLIQYLVKYAVTTKDFDYKKVFKKLKN
ncbi:MAG: hypothetical protein Q8K60_00785 [Parachlamydiaceae bacterium]|nr:hypothetical protein [Parachlamydiaceae bacterium]